MHEVAPERVPGALDRRVLLSHHISGGRREAGLRKSDQLPTVATQTARTADTVECSIGPRPVLWLVRFQRLMVLIRRSAVNYTKLYYSAQARMLGGMEQLGDPDCRDS